MNAIPEGRAILEAVLERTTFLSSLPVATRDRLGSLADVVSFEPSEVVFREGEPSQFLGIVVRGRLALRLAVPGRHPTTVLTVDRGDLVGWSAVVAPYRSTSTAVALEPSQIVVFEADRLRKAIADEPQLAAAILPPILSAMARRLAACRLQNLDLFRAGPAEPW
jgi:CRP/FNR family transcriptional regulator, cyclic AMP receptor protein